VPPLAIGNMPVTFVVRSIAPSVISPFTIKPVDSNPEASLCTTLPVLKAGSVIVFSELPIVTGPVDDRGINIRWKI